MRAATRPPADRIAAPHNSPGARPPLWALVGGLVLVHLVVTLMVRPNPRWNDAIYVLNDARSFPDVPLDHHALRIGNLLPARLLLELFGYGQVAYYAWPFLTGILLVVATFALGAVLFGRWTGAAAGLLIVFHPALVETEIRFGIERMTSWHLLPDIPSAAFVTAGFALLVGAAGRPSRTGAAGDGDSDAAGPTWMFLLAGLCFGWAYLVRELSVFVFPVIAAVLLGWRLPLRRWVQVVAPMVGCLIVELALAAAVHGDALARLHVGAEHGSAPLGDLTRLDAVLRFPRAVETYSQTVAVLASLALTVLGALLVRRRGHVLMLGWLVSTWLPLTLVSGLIDPGFIRINASLMRYWIPVLPPLCIGAAATMAALLQAVRRRAPSHAHRLVARICTVIAFAGIMAWCLPLLDDIAGNPRDAKWNALRAHLHDSDGAIDTVVTDDRDALTLGVYQREPIGGDPAWRAEIAAVPHGLSEAPAPEGDAGTVLLWTPELSPLPPTADSGWQVVFRRPGLRLYAPTTSP